MDASDAGARDEVLEDARSHEETEVLVELVLCQLEHAGWRSARGPAKTHRQRRFF